MVVIADVLGMMMWCEYFTEAQGYTIDNNILYQDNKITILLAKNGRMSARKNSKHIKNRFLLSVIRWPKVISRSSTWALAICGVT